MPRPANPLTSISKKLETLKVKSEKLAQEIADLSSLVAMEAGNVQSIALAPAEKKPASKKTTSKKVPATMAPEPQKKRGRHAKAKPQNTPDYLSRLNADPETDTPSKKRGKK